MQSLSHIGYSRSLYLTREGLQLGNMEVWVRCLSRDVVYSIGFCTTPWPFVPRWLGLWSIACSITPALSSTPLASRAARTSLVLSPDVVFISRANWGDYLSRVVDPRPAYARSEAVLGEGGWGGIKDASLQIVNVFNNRKRIDPPILLV